MATRKIRPKNYLDPLKVNIVLLGLVIISVIALLSLSVGKAKSNYLAAQRQLSSLHYKSSHLKPEGDRISNGKFSLTAHEEQLSNQYTKLATDIFGGFRNTKDFYRQKSNIVKCFGETGYSQIKSHVIATSKGKKIMVPKRNTKVVVTFSNYNAMKNTIDVTIYTEYETASDKRIDYINTTYSFNSDRATFGSVRMSILSNENDDQTSDNSVTDRNQDNNQGDDN